MRVVTLFENRTISKEYKNSHGLSLYIETAKHKILFDTGANKEFADNAPKLGVNLEEVDIAVISHGHYDHGGGLETFLKLNSKAKIYIGKGAFEPHVRKLLGFIKFNIGIKKELVATNRFIFVEDIAKIDDELTIFGDVKGDKLVPEGNRKLLKEYEDGSIRGDDFEHEINLIINEKNKYSLICGCAHRGIVNIIERARGISDSDLNTVIGGFHLMDLKIKNPKDVGFLDELTEKLSSSGVEKYYTCHCTGEESYGYMNQRMNNLGEIKTGMVIEV